LPLLKSPGPPPPPPIAEIDANVELLPRLPDAEVLRPPLPPAPTVTVYVKFLFKTSVDSEALFCPEVPIDVLYPPTPPPPPAL